MQPVPDDILLAILSHLAPRDISFVRQASKHLNRLSHERAVWATLYRNSPLFLPPGPLPTHSAAHLEQLILRAIALDNVWNLSSPSPRLKRLIPAANQHYHAVFLHNQYLVLGAASSFSVYDLEQSTNSPPLVAQLSESSSNFISYHHIPDASHSLGSSFLLAACRRGSSVKPTIVVWKVAPTLSPHPQLIAQVPLSSPTFPYIRMAFDYLLIDFPERNTSSIPKSSASLLHIPSNILYTVPPSSHSGPHLSGYHKEYILTSRHLILVHIPSISPRNSPALFESFSLPLDSLTGSALQSMHKGTYNIIFKEPLLLESRPTPLPDVHRADLTFMAVRDVQPTGILVFNLHLLPDGSIDISNVAHRGLDMSPAATPFNLHATSSARCSARAISMTDFMYTNEFRNCLSRYDIFYTHDSDKTIRVRSLHLRDLPSIHDITFDGIRGRVGLVLDSGDAVILDYI